MAADLIQSFEICTPDVPTDIADHVATPVGRSLQMRVLTATGLAGTSLPAIQKPRQAPRSGRPSEVIQRSGPTPGWIPETSATAILHMFRFHGRTRGRGILEQETGRVVIRLMESSSTKVKTPPLRHTSTGRTKPSRTHRA